MVIEVLFIGILLGYLYYEVTGISPGGVIAPGYFALFIKQPDKMGMTIIVSLLVWATLQFLSRHFILYGRRKLLMAILMGFFFKLVIEIWIQPVVAFHLDLQSIGYIIPGLIANEMTRQKILPTIFSLGIVTILVYFIIILIV
jgi:poly-gamma-glutamate biosynthesis protein PgsC/CapC